MAEDMYICGEEVEDDIACLQGRPLPYGSWCCPRDRGTRHTRHVFPCKESLLKRIVSREQ